MSLFSLRAYGPARASTIDVAQRLRRFWQEHLRCRAERAALDRMLARGDDHLLQDIGIDRATGHRMLGETLVQPHRAWDRWPS